MASSITQFTSKNNLKYLQSKVKFTEDDLTEFIISETTYGTAAAPSLAQLNYAFVKRISNERFDTAKSTLTTPTQESYHMQHFMDESVHDGPIVPDDDMDDAWDAGNHARSYKQASDEYYDKIAYGKVSWTGSKPMRKPEIPFWQKSGQRAYETDIRDTLGQNSGEYESQIRSNY